MDSGQQKSNDLDDLFLESRNRLENWYRQLMTLAASALTLLVAFQGTYLGPTSVARWLIGACWLGLATTVGSTLLARWGLVVGPGELGFQLHRDAQSSRDQRSGGAEPQTTSARLVGSRQDRSTIYLPRPKYRVARKVAIVSFAASLFCLTAFALVNLYLS